MNATSTELSAQELFAKYDTDNSGKISLEEFKPLLEELGLNLTVPKVLEYFQLCDSDGSGEIDYDEFKVALYVCNSEDLNPNGFNPGSILRPKDAFDMFDKDKSGQLDETEFGLLLEYLDIDTDETTFEKMFFKYDTDRSGFIEYPEFKKVWLRLANPKKELEDRGIDIPTLFTRAQMIRLLEDVLGEEERREALAVEKAKEWKRQQELLRMRKKYTTKALRRSYIELCRALDAGGQVYVFGDGTMDQFRTVEHRSFNGIEPLLVDLWYERIGRCRQSMDINDTNHGGMLLSSCVRDKDSSSVSNSAFKNLNVQSNSVALWGRDVTGIAISDTAMMALYDDDTIVSWGGRGQWWHELESDSHWQEVERGLFTARSNVIQGRQYPKEALKDTDEPSIKEKHNPYTIGFGEKFEKTKCVLQYYEVWGYDESEEIDNALEYSKKCLQKNVKPERLTESLKMRGRPCSDKTKNQMIGLLYDCVKLELKVLGEAKHLMLRDLEKEILSLRTKRKMRLAKRRLAYFMEAWVPVNAAFQLHEKNDSSSSPETKGERRDAEASSPSSPSISNNVSKREKWLLNEIKPIRYPSRMKLKSIKAGANHAGVLSEHGHLYMWGVNTTGKLGVVGLSTYKDPNGDIHEPIAIPSLKNSSISSFSCGHSHTAAIDNGNLLVWGSSSSGKLGLGELPSSKECYCAIPRQVTFPSKSQVVQVSCGSNHTAACNVIGHLFVWGNGNGYRLGLGDSFDRLTPTMVNNVQNICSVSCGNCQTLAISRIFTKKTIVNKSEVNIVSGGNLYVAGQASILGTTFKFFGEYDNFKCDDVEVSPRRIHRISSGFSHQAAVSTDGELFCWGDNTKGSCCHDVNVNFIPIPSQVTSLCKKPNDLSIGKPTRSSPPYGEQPFYDINLEVMSTIHEIKLYNTLDDPKNPANTRDEFTSRLFPCWIMISQEAFPLSTGKGDLNRAMNTSISKKRLVDNRHVSSWRRKLQIVGSAFSFIVRTNIPILFSTFRFISTKRYNGTIHSYSIGGIKFNGFRKD